MLFQCTEFYKNDTFVVNKLGIYWYELQLDCGIYRDTIIYSKEPKSEPIIPFDDTALCFSNNIKFDTKIPWQPNYYWQNGDTGSVLLIDSSQWIILNETKYCGIQKDSAYIHLIKTPQNPPNIDTILCVKTGETYNFNSNSNNNWFVLNAADTITLNDTTVLYLDSVGDYQFFYNVNDSF